jgi:hypothetical protein
LPKLGPDRFPHSTPPEGGSCRLGSPDPVGIAPWGVVLATRCGSMAAPLDLASGGRRLTPPPSSSISAGAFHYNPGHSRGQERGAIDEAVSFTSFDRSTRGAPLRPAPFQRRGCEPLSVFLGPRGAFTVCRRSLTLSLSPAGTPESVSETARSAGRLSYALRQGTEPDVDLQAEGPWNTRPLRV